MDAWSKESRFPDLSGTSTSKKLNLPDLQSPRLKVNRRADFMHLIARIEIEPLP